MIYQRYHFERLTSTNDYAKELLQKHNCVVVTADFQTQGRGRNKNQWLGEYAQNVYLSFGVKHPNLRLFEEVAYFQGLGALAVYNTLVKITPTVQYALKYPNDIYAKTKDSKFRKISGVLVEHQFVGNLCVSTVLGIGINVNQKEFPKELSETAISLRMLGYDFKVEDIVNHLISEIERLMELFPDEIFQIWKNKLNIIGKEIFVVNRQLLCKVEGMDSIGRLIAVANNNEKLLISDGDSIRYELEG
ncbi:MAG: hypothetical protein CH6_4037 [Candidatus Kapaibacterium sp.]|nr:MAG: hypothetical protein CH6_4037 [Candidatus Kapabacteria bacterium]